MNLSFNQKLAERYKSPSQKIKVLSESWVHQEIFCPNCGKVEISKYENNKPVADFFCSHCKEDYELKSKKDQIGNKIVDGEYDTMIRRLTGSKNPNFFLLAYEPMSSVVSDFLVIPKHFFVPEIIEKRKPLSPKAKRANWTGCNILLNTIPESGKIFFIKDSQIEPKEKVISEWQKTLFLKDEKEISAKGWLLDIMRIIEKLGKKEFVLEDLYKSGDELSLLHPDNHHIKDKIRQQLQILRDKGYLEFVGGGMYELS